MFNVNIIHHTIAGEHINVNDRKCYHISKLCEYRLAVKIVMKHFTVKTFLTFQTMKSAESQAGKIAGACLLACNGRDI